MKTANIRTLACAALVAGMTGAGAEEEEIDWRRLVELVEARETKQGPVMLGKGGIRIELPIVEKEKARMRAFIEADRKNAVHPPLIKVVEPKFKRSFPDPFGRTFNQGDWNMGKPSAGSARNTKPRG